MKREGEKVCYGQLDQGRNHLSHEFNKTTIKFNYKTSTKYLFDYVFTKNHKQISITKLDIEFNEMV